MTWMFFIGDGSHYVYASREGKCGMHTSLCSPYTGQKQAVGRAAGGVRRHCSSAEVANSVRAANVLTEPRQSSTRPVLRPIGPEIQFFDFGGKKPAERKGMEIARKLLILKTCSGQGFSGHGFVGNELCQAANCWSSA